MSFKESIIIPLETYRRCRFGPTDLKQTILADTTLPPDKKMKMLSHQRTLEKLQKGKASKRHTPRPTAASDYSHILHNFSLDDQPHTQAILEMISKHPSDISWDARDQTIAIDGISIPDSNIVKTLQYFSKSLPVRDIPAGTKDVLVKLDKLKVPKAWIRQRPVAVRTPSTRVKKRRKPYTPDQSPRWEPFT